MAQCLSKVDLIVSDFDGTLCNLAVNWPQLKSDFGLSFIESGWDLCGQPKEQFWRAVADAEYRAVEHSELIMPVVAFLESSDRLVILTNNSEQAVAQFIARHGLFKPMTHLSIVGRETLGGSKRNRSLFTSSIELAISNNSTRPSRVAYIGDSDYELEYAHEMGLVVLRADCGHITEFSSQR